MEINRSEGNKQAEQSSRRRMRLLFTSTLSTPSATKSLARRRRSLSCGACCSAWPACTSASGLCGCMHHLQLLCIAVVLYEWALCNERGQHVIRAQRNKLQQKRCASTDRPLHVLTYASVESRLQLPGHAVLHCCFRSCRIIQGLM